MDNKSKEYSDTVLMIKKLISEALSKSPDVPPDWFESTDVGYALLDMAAEITINEEKILPLKGLNCRALFVEWSTRAYDAHTLSSIKSAAKKKRIKS